LQAVHQLDVRVDREAGLTHPFEGLHVLGELGTTFDRTQLVGPEAQLPRRGDRWILLAKRAGRGVARVDEGTAGRLTVPAVEVLEGWNRHVDLSPDLDDVGRRRRKPAGDGLDGDHIGGDVLSYLAISPSGRPGEKASLVDEVHRQTVDLGLAGVRHHSG